MTDIDYGQAKGDGRSAALANEISQCPSCGGVLVYSPTEKVLKCLYCDSTVAIKELQPARSKDYLSQGEGGNFEDWDNQLVSFRCSSCGAVNELSKYDTAPNCPFCGAPNLIKQEEIKGLKPNAILPFLLDREQAVAAYKKWVKKRIFAPSKLKRNFDAETMKGVYIPCFTFSANTHSSYSGVLGKKYTVTVGSGKNKRVETRVKYFNVSGVHDRDFSDLMYEVSAKLTQKELNKMRQFDIANAVEYTTEFIPGFSQERYTESLDTTYGRAQNDMNAAIRSNILNKYDADVVKSLDVNTQFSSVRYKYLMSPVWECFYKFKDKGYRMMVNGRNGFVAGKTPLSPIRVLIAAVVALGLVALAAWLYMISG